MVLQVAEALVLLLTAYVAVGALVALACLCIGPRAWPRVAAPMTWPARLLVLPGTVLLWPWLAWQWRRGARPNP